MTLSLAGIPRFQTFTAEYLEYNGILPLEKTDNSTLIATWKDQVDVQVVDELTLLFGAVPEFRHYEAEEIRAAIARTYANEGRTAHDVLQEIGDSSDSTPASIAVDDVRAQANEAPIIRLVSALLVEALEARASDVHLEAGGSGLVVRYRIDGVLHEVAAPPANVSAAVLSRVKIMADLDIAERRLPQDGRIRLKLQNRDVDVRVSTLPALRGESVVMRLLDRQRNDARLADIGLASDTLALLRKFIGRPHGMLLVTGPTGSGKTTTLYAALDALRTGHQKIITVEDPVEYELSGVTQVQVNAKIGLTFATALRAILRQDPDIVLVGEIRDPETAAIAVHAALTGHLVLATLHTNNAAGALTRMIDLGIAPYLLASTVDAVLAQRLVRRLCEECGKTDGAEPHARGCTTCRQTGYRGRTGVFELLAIDDRLRHVIAVNPDTNQIHAAAVEAGMRTLLRDGERLVAEGLTTLEEVLRVVRD